MTCFRTCSRRHARSQAGLCHCTNLLMSDQISQPSCSSVTLWEETAPVKLPTRHCPQPGSRVYVRTPAIKGWYFKRLHADWRPRFKASHLSHIKDQCSVSSYSKGSRGLSVLPRVHCIFTASSISLSLGWRQPGHHYAIRAGRNLPDKEFRYLRTVIVTAAVYRASIKSFALPLTPSINLPAPGRRHTVYVHFRVCTVLCFNKQLQPAGIFD